MNTQVPLRTPIDVGPPGGARGMTAEEAAPHQDLSIELRLIWSAFYRNRILIAAIVAACIILGLIATMLTTRQYRSTASVQVEQQTSKVLDSQDTDPVQSVQDADRFLQTQSDILNSRALAIRVMEALNLAANDNFVTAMHKKPLDEPIGALDLPSSKREQILQIISDNLTIDLPRNSRIISISFRSPSPALAARIANSFAENFILSNMRRRFDTSAYARNFLQQQLADTKQRLEDSEKATIGYARSAGLIDASAGIGTTDAAMSGPRSLTTSNLVALNSSYVQARSDRIEAQQHWEQALRTPVMNLPEVNTNSAIMQLQQVRAQAQAAYEEEREHHKPDYPTMMQAQAQIASLDAQINKLALGLRDGIREHYLTTLHEESALNGNVGQLKQDTLSEQDRSIRYNILKRETDTNRTMYDGLLQRYKEVSAEAGISANNISPIDTAEPSADPISPKPLLNLFLATVAGLALAGGLIFVREKFDDAVRSPEDVSRKLGLTFLNSIPLLRTGESPIRTLGDPRSAFSEAYQALRTSLELVTTNGMPRSLLLTSSRQSEGKSTSAYAIARDFARIGRNVVLIDGDLRKPSLHRLVGASNKNGFASLLARHRELHEVIQPTDTPNLSFISTGPLPPNPAELLSGAMLPSVLKQIGETFDLVVVDGPPVLGLADAVLLANNVEGTVFIIEANGSHHGHAKAAIRRLADSGATMLGALLTKYDARKVGYGDYYGYYSYSYGNENREIAVADAAE